MVEIKWEYSLETEAKRIVHAARQMVVGFYRLNGFNVLPYQNSNARPDNNVVYLPDLDYKKINKFWEKVGKADVYRLIPNIDQELMNELVAILKEANYPEPEINQVNNIWEKIEKEFFETIEKIVPDLKGSVKSITIHPTMFGTKCSFNVPEKLPCDLIVYLRSDQDFIYGLVESILSALTRDSVYKKLDGSWQEAEMLVDWLITESAIGKVINKYHDIKFYQPTIRTTRIKQSAQTLKQSDEFYKKLGLPSFEKPFKNVDGQPVLFDKKMVDLAPQESLVLVKLIENENKVTTFDEIAQVTSKSEDDFSLYAISKTIQRIRDSLEANGVSGSFIQTMRGRGYVLKN